MGRGAHFRRVVCTAGADVLPMGNVMVGKILGGVGSWLGKVGAASACFLVGASLIKKGQGGLA